MRPAERFYRQAEKMEPLIWRLCDYRHDLGQQERCRRCPISEMSDHGIVHRGCRMIAEEMIAIVLEHIEPPAANNDAA